METEITNYIVKVDDKEYKPSDFIEAHPELSGAFNQLYGIVNNNVRINSERGNNDYFQMINENTQGVLIFNIPNNGRPYLEYLGEFDEQIISILL